MYLKIVESNTRSKKNISTEFVRQKVLACLIGEKEKLMSLVPTDHRVAGALVLEETGDRSYQAMPTWVRTVCMQGYG